MQRIERYGVIALVLLLVTIAAVSFWEQDGKDAAPPEGQLAQAPAERLTPRDADRKLPVTAQPTVDSRERQRNNAQQSQQRKLHEAAQRAQAERDREMQLAAAQARAAQTPSQPQEQAPAEPPREQPQELGFPEALVKADEPTTLQPHVPQAQPQPRVEREQRGMHVVELVGKTARPGAGAARTHTVKAGETLGEIAYAELGSSKRWREIAALNGDSETIYEGQVLQLPAGEAAAQAPVAAAAPKTAALVANAAAPKAGAGTYTVRKGDMLSVIAQQQLGSAKRWREIAALNPKVDPDRLLEGTVLVLPTDAKPAVTTVAAREASAPVASSRRRVQ